MKFFHNDKVSLGWALLVEIAVHLLFAFQAFLLGGFLGDIALAAIFGAVIGARIGAWALAIFVFMAAFQCFVLGEYMKEHVQSFENTGRDGSYMRAWQQLRWLVGGIEISSLLFRCITIMQIGNFSMSSIVQAVIVAVLGGILLWYAFAQAKVIHASVNRPIEFGVMQAQYQAGTSLVEDSLRYTRYMTPEQKARFAGGDISAVQEVAESGFFERENKRQMKEQSKTAREQAKLAKAQAKYTKVLAAQQQEEDGRQQQEQAKSAASRLFDPSSWGRRGHQHHQPLPGYPKLDPSTDFPEALSNRQANHQSQNGHR